MPKQQYVEIPEKLKDFVTKMEGTYSSLKHFEVSQRKAFVGLMNSVLSKKGLAINDLSRDLRNGYLIYQFLKSFVKLPFSIPSKKTKSVFDCFDNMQKLFDFLRSRNTILSLNESMIVEGTQIKPYLAVIWHLICHYYLPHTATSRTARMSVGEKEMLQSLLNWANSRLPEEKHVKNFTSDFQDGSTFAHLLAAIKPDSVTVEDLLKETPVETLQTVFDTASQHCGIEKVLEAVTFAEHPDKESSVVYLSLFQAFEKFEKEGKKEQEALQDELSLASEKAASSEKERQKLENALSECRSSSEELRNKLRALEQETELLKNHLHKHETENRYLSSQISNLQNTIIDKNTAIEEKDAELQAFTRKQQIAADELKKTKQAAGTLQKKSHREVTFEKMLQELDVPLRTPTFADFSDVNLQSILGEKDVSVKNVVSNKWICDNCSYRNLEKDFLCKNCFFMKTENGSKEKDLIEPSDFVYSSLVLEDPPVYQLTYIFFVGKRKHSLRFEHNPIIENRKLLFDGNVLYIKKKGVFSNPNSIYEFYCSEKPALFSVRAQKKKKGEYEYQFKIDGKTFEEYKTAYFKERQIF